MILSSHSVGIFPEWMIFSIRSRICWAPSTPEAFSFQLQSVMYQQPCHISSAWWPWSPAQMVCDGTGLPRDRLPWGRPGPSRTLHSRGAIVFFPGSLLGPVIQAQLSSIISDRFLTLDIQGFASRLVGEAETVSVTGWRVLEDFLFSLGFGQIDSMFGDALHLLKLLYAATFLPGFPASPLFLDCVVDSRIPPPGLFLPPVFLGRPAHIFSCLQQTGLQFFKGLFCPITTSIAWGCLRNESLWLPEAPKSVPRP